MHKTSLSEAEQDGRSSNLPSTGTIVPLSVHPCQQLGFGGLSAIGQNSHPNSCSLGRSSRQPLKISEKILPQGRMVPWKVIRLTVCWPERSISKEPPEFLSFPPIILIFVQTCDLCCSPYYEYFLYFFLLLLSPYLG